MTLANDGVDDAIATDRGGDQLVQLGGNDGRRRRLGVVLLQAEERRVAAAAAQQVLVAAGLDDLAALDHQNLVGVHDGRQPVRHHDGGAALAQMAMASWT